MTVQAQNALLKTLEEPPEYARDYSDDDEPRGASSDDPEPVCAIEYEAGKG